MGKSDIVASLKLNSTDYEQKLAKAKESTRKFSEDGGQGLADIAGKFGKLAVAVAGSQAAMEVFNKVMDSSQTYADNYGNAMATVRGVVDNVVYSLANADFSSFERGLRAVAEASWAASAALDQLWNTKQSASYFTAKNRAQLTELLNVARDESKTAEQRKQAQAMIDAVLEDQREVVATTRKDVDTAIFALINEAAGGRLSEGQVNKALIEETLRIDVSVDREKLKEDLYAQYEIYRNESEAIAKQYRERITQADAMGRIMSVSWGVNEQGKQLLAELDAKYADIIVKHATLEVMSDEELANLIEQLNYSEQQSKIMEKMVSQRVALNNQLTKQLSVEDKITSEYQKRGLGTMVGIGEGTSASELPATLPSVEPVILYEKELQILQDTAVSASEGLGALGGAMGNLSGMLGEGAGAWMSYAGGIVSAVGSALPSLEALAAAQAAAAVTKTALSPWTVVSGIAAVTSIIAAMAQLPKFATGGIVPGNALSGDNVLIRANSGETVLTKQQANNIGSLLQGFGGTVKFKIEGGDLVGVLNNHNSITSRSYGTKNG